MSLDAEILYGTTETIPIHFKLFIISNHSPTFLHDNGMENRLRVLKFRSRFRDDVENDSSKYIFQKDRNLYEFCPLLSSLLKSKVVGRMRSFISSKTCERKEFTDYGSCSLHI